MNFYYVCMYVCLFVWYVQRTCPHQARRSCRSSRLASLWTSSASGNICWTSWCPSSRDLRRTARCTSQRYEWVCLHTYIYIHPFTYKVMLRCKLTDKGIRNAFHTYHTYIHKYIFIHRIKWPSRSERSIHNTFHTYVHANIHTLVNLFQMCVCHCHRIASRCWMCSTRRFERCWATAAWAPASPRRWFALWSRPDTTQPTSKGCLDQVSMYVCMYVCMCILEIFFVWNCFSVHFVVSAVVLYVCMLLCETFFLYVCMYVCMCTFCFNGVSCMQCRGSHRSRGGKGCISGK